MSEKALPGRAIYGWDSTNETWVKILVDTSGNLQITSTDLTTILSEIQNATYGLEAIKDAIDLIDVSGTADAVWDEAKSGHVTAGTFGKEVQDILTALQHGTYGLSAIETLVDEIESLLKNETYGLSAIETLIDDLEGRLTATRAGYLDELDFGLAEYLEDLRQKATSPAWNQDTDSLEAIREVIDTLLTESQSHPTLAEIEASNLDAAISTRAPSGEYDTQLSTTERAAASALEDAMQKVTSPSYDQDTDSLEAISEAVATVSSKTTNLPTDPADASDIAADFDRHLTPLDFWGDPIGLVTITGSSSDVNLPDVIVPVLPTGATIWKVQLIGYISAVRDNSASDNAINGVAAIRIKKSTGAWGTDDIVALDIPDNFLAVDVSTSADRGGAPLIGNLNNDNLSGEVDEAATYNLRFEDIAADGNNLLLLDVQVGLRVWIY